MAEITESRIQAQMRENMYEYGIDSSEPYAHELAELQLKDLQRKGCTLEGPDCRECSLMGKECPIIDWEKHHPEFKNDELEHRIEVLEAGGDEAYKAKLKAREEAKRKAEEEKNRAKDEDRIDAACKVLQIIKDSKQPISAPMIDAVVDLIHNEKTTKLELEAAIAKFQ